MKTTAALSILGLALALAPQLSAQQRLADFRRVVVPDQASAIQKVAADELVAYAGKVGGRKLEIVPLSNYAGAAEGFSFFVGDAVAEKVLGAKSAPWKEEEWMLKSVPKGLVLAGDEGPGDPWAQATRAGTLLAVYTLLDDHLGVKWLWPGPFGEHVPSNPEAVVPPLDLRATPKFFIRSIQFGYPRYHTNEFRDEAQKWARRQRLGWTRSATFGHSWYYAFDTKSGEQSKAFTEHPEWFALYKGKRQPPHLCTTHPDVRQVMVDYVLNSKYSICHISPSDGFGFCECTEETKSETHKKLGLPSCASLDVPGYMTYDRKSLQLSDRIFTYANEVARRVREKDPNKSVGMFAYTYYAKPPIHLDHIEPNLYLSFCYQSMAFRDPQALAEWHDSVDGWKKFGTKMVVREGWGAHYLLDLPFMNYDQTLANIAESYRMGFIAGYGEGTKCFATQAPNQWAIARMLADPERDTVKTMDDFFQSAYGPVAAEMRAYFETWNQSLNENWSKRRKVMDTPGFTYVNVVNSWDITMPPSVVEKAGVHLKAAEAKAPAGEYADRVAFHRFGYEYSKVVLATVDCYRQLAELGVDLEFFKLAVPVPRKDDAEKQRLLKRAYELGEEREKMLLMHRDWAGPDEGLYGQTIDSKNRLWHSEVKKELGIDKPSAVSMSTLQPDTVTTPKRK